MIVDASKHNHSLYRKGSVSGAIAYHLEGLLVGEYLEFDEFVNWFGEELPLTSVRSTICPVVKKLKITVITRVNGPKGLTIYRVS
tara:strand:- start:1227 stop:1481 length:255 start_codon:yes stop_codon:yes gene_type:complete